MDGLQIIENKVMETLQQITVQQITDEITDALEARFTALENRIAALEEKLPVKEG